ncbi:MAG: hypothetical protein V7647_4128 [Acidobacteriota bacterium]|jgi:hypothetical protein
MMNGFPLDVRCAVPAFAALVIACASLNSQTYSFATLDEARASGAIANGWVPEGLPAGSHDIRVAQVPNTTQRWGIVNFPPAEEASLRRLLRSDETSLGGEHCDMPGRIEWWPVVLRGTLDASSVAATGLHGYRSKSGDLLFAVNWNQGRAYYWRAGG